MGEFLLDVGDCLCNIYRATRKLDLGIGVSLHNVKEFHSKMELLVVEGVRLCLSK